MPKIVTSNPEAYAENFDNLSPTAKLSLTNLYSQYSENGNAVINVSFNEHGEAKAVVLDTDYLSAQVESLGGSLSYEGGEGGNYEPIDWSNLVVSGGVDEDGVGIDLINIEAQAIGADAEAYFFDENGGAVVVRGGASILTVEGSLGSSSVSALKSGNYKDLLPDASVAELGGGLARMNAPEASLNDNGNIVVTQQMEEVYGEISAFNIPTGPSGSIQCEISKDSLIDGLLDAAKPWNNPAINPFATKELLDTVCNENYNISVQANGGLLGGGITLGNSNETFVQELISNLSNKDILLLELEALQNSDDPNLAAQIDRVNQAIDLFERQERLQNIENKEEQLQYLQEQRDGSNALNATELQNDIDQILTDLENDYAEQGTTREEALLDQIEYLKEQKSGSNALNATELQIEIEELEQSLSDHYAEQGTSRQEVLEERLEDLIAQRDQSNALNAAELQKEIEDIETELQNYQGDSDSDGNEFDLEVTDAEVENLAQEVEHNMNSLFQNLENFVQAVNGI